MMDSWYRIERVIRWAGLSVNSFALYIGMLRAESIYQIKRGNNGVSCELAKKIVARYPQISQAWLLTGEGDMFAAEIARQSQVPFYDVDIEKYVASPTRFSCEAYVSLPDVGGAEFGARYRGRAMGEAVPDGAMVLVKKVPLEDLVSGSDCVVVAEGLTILRRVVREPESQVLRLTSVEVPDIDEIRLNVTEVRELFQVCAVIVNKTRKCV
jgi:hypothetical protein